MSTTAPGCVLAIEASTRGGEIALRAGGETRSHVLDAEASHGSDLVPAIEALVQDAGLSPTALELVVVGRGPGSYTGLRVAAATALGLARGTGAALVGVPSFSAAARAGLEPGERGAVLRNAFGGTVYVGVYGRNAEGALEVHVEPTCIPVEDAVRTIGPVDVVLAASEIANAAGIEAPRREPVPGATALLDLGCEAFAESGSDPDSTAPLYLRPFDAKVRAR